MKGEYIHCGEDDCILISGIDIESVNLDSMNKLFEVYCLEYLNEDISEGSSLESYLERDFSINQIQDFLKMLDYRAIFVTSSNRFEKQKPQLIFFKTIELFCSSMDFVSIEREHQSVLNELMSL